MKYDIIAPCFPILDVIIPMESVFPIQAGESKIVHSITDEAGGPANSFIVATRMGATVLPVGVVGDDDHGRFLLRCYEQEGIDTTAITTEAGYATPQALCISDPTGKHAFITMVHAKLATDLAALKALLDQGRSMVLTGYLLASNLMQDVAHAAVQYAAAEGKEVFFDPGPLIPQIPKQVLLDVLASTTALVVNDEEAALLSGKTEIEDAAAVLHGMINGVVVIKAGPRGCYVYDGKGAWYGGFTVPLVDTTGAGDSFMGAFMHARLSGWSLGAAAIFANAAGAVKTSKMGSGRQVPTFAEMVSLLEANGYAIPEECIQRGSFSGVALQLESR